MFGEVFLFRMSATDGAEGKSRPVLVLFDLEADAVVCRITSVLRSGVLDVFSSGWREEGLLKPSIARLARIVTMEKSLLVKKLGQLSARDLEAVRTRWNSSMKL